MNPIHHLFVAFEGIDGSGKSTQVRRLRRSLEHMDVRTEVVKAKWPRQQRTFAAFVNAFGIRPDSLSFMFLYQALHRVQFERVVAARALGLAVIADRWNGSFHVYHRRFGPLAREEERLRCDIDRLAFDGLSPDICFLLDVPVEIALARRMRRGESFTDAAAERAFYTTVRDEYLALAAEKGWTIVDGTQGAAAVASEVAGHIIRLRRE